MWAAVTESRWSQRLRTAGVLQRNAMHQNSCELHWNAAGMKLKTILLKNLAKSVCFHLLISTTGSSDQEAWDELSSRSTFGSWGSPVLVGTWWWGARWVGTSPGALLLHLTWIQPHQVRAREGTGTGLQPDPLIHRNLSASWFQCEDPNTAECPWSQDHRVIYDL